MTNDQLKEMAEGIKLIAEGSKIILKVAGSLHFLEPHTALQIATEINTIAVANNELAKLTEKEIDGAFINN